MENKTRNTINIMLLTAFITFFTMTIFNNVYVFYCCGIIIINMLKNYIKESFNINYLETMGRTPVSIFLLYTTQKTIPTYGLEINQEVALLFAGLMLFVWNILPLLSGIKEQILQNRIDNEVTTWKTTATKNISEKENQNQQ